MSLHTASKYLASKGRKGDTELVHMTRDEVRGLQELALAHGGSLTINPDTGLPEAGFLKSILPMVAGAALTVATGGTALAAYAPLLAAAAAGGGMYAATGSLKDGLLAGLGAFGGAGLAGGVMSAGAAGAEVGADLAATGVEAGAANSAQVAAQSTQAMDAMTKAGLTFDQQAAALQGLPGASTAETAANATQSMDAMTKAGMGFDQQAQALKAVQGPYGQQIANVGSGAGGFGTGVGQPTNFTEQLSQNASQFGRGLPDIGKVVMDNPKSAIAAVSPFFMGSQSSAGPDQGSSDYTSPLASLSPNFQGFQPTPPNPAYQAEYKDYKKRGLAAYQGYAGGGVVALADGGMDPMSPMQNTIYPQSQQRQTAFATSPQMPNSLNAAMASDYDARTNPATGQELPMGMASGGVAGYATGHLASSPSMPSGGVYRDTDADTASKDAMQAALIRLQKANKLAGIKGAPMPKANMERLGAVDMDERAYGGVVGYADGGDAAPAAAPAAPASGVPALAGLAAARAALGLGPTPIASGLMSAQRAMSPAPVDNAALMAQLSGYNPFQSAKRAANTGYQTATNQYFNTPIYTPRASTTYKFATPLATAESIARDAAIRQEAERIAAEKYASSNESSPSSWSYASGGVTGYNLGGYSDGGRLLKGPGDGMSDDIPASIGKRQPARLADGEFVVPADVVSHLGNGSTDAGAKKLYGMMDKVRQARTGKKKQAPAVKTDKYIPK